MTRKFIADITPYFHAHPVVYVDGDAHVGKTLRAFVESGLPLREAHLIEPNPASFTALRATTEQLRDKIGRIRLHNVALGAAPGRVRMSDAGTMSRVLAPAEGEESGPNETGFVADCVTLDSLAWDFVDGHADPLTLRDRWGLVFPGIDYDRLARSLLHDRGLPALLRDQLRPWRLDEIVPIDRELRQAILGRLARSRWGLRPERALWIARQRRAGRKAGGDDA